jgi:glycosyltransferase involved in cell wall biosynthesis
MRSIISIFKPISTNYLFTKKKIAIVSVINDLVSDVRVRKNCEALMESGYEVILVGRLLPNSPQMPVWPWQSHRMRLLFRSGPIFYFFFQIRLFLFLLFKRADLLFANDLDTLAPNFILSRLKSIPLVYDSHELFCEVPELRNSPIKRSIWKSIERFIVPRLNYCLTVNDSIANIFYQEYQTYFISVRNIPPAQDAAHLMTRAKLGLPTNKYILLLQGAGINVERGAEELVDAMAYLDEHLLLIIGSGDVWPVLEQKAKSLPTKVRLIARLPKEQLVSYTHAADLGISVDKDTNLNYHFSLPNKVFDYIHAGLPILASRLPEIEQLVSRHQVGEFIDSHDPKHIAERIRGMLTSERFPEYKRNALKAAETLTWQNEKQKLLKLLSEVQSHTSR